MTPNGTAHFLLMDDAGCLVSYATSYLDFKPEQAYTADLPGNLQEALLSSLGMAAELFLPKPTADNVRINDALLIDGGLYLSGTADMGGVEYSYTVRAADLAIMALEPLSLERGSSLWPESAWYAMQDWIATNVSGAVLLRGLTVDDTGALQGVLALYPEGDGLARELRLSFDPRTGQVDQAEAVTSAVPEAAPDAAVITLSTLDERYQLIGGKWMVRAQDGGPAMEVQAIRTVTLSGEGWARRGAVPDQLTQVMGEIAGEPAVLYISEEAMARRAAEAEFEASPVHEEHVLTVAGEEITVRALLKHSLYASFAAPPEGARDPAEILTIALETICRQYGQEPSVFDGAEIEIGYQAESAAPRWQVDAPDPANPGFGYELMMDDATGDVLQLWGPSDGNG